MAVTTISRAIPLSREGCHSERYSKRHGTATWSSATVSMTVSLIGVLVSWSLLFHLELLRGLFACRNAMYDLRSELIVSPALNRPDQRLCFNFNGLYIRMIR